MIVFRRSEKYIQVPVPKANGNTSQEAFFSLIEAFGECHRHCHSFQSRVLTCSVFVFLSSPEATLWQCICCLRNVHLFELSGERNLCGRVGLINSRSGR